MNTSRSSGPARHRGRARDRKAEHIHLALDGQNQADDDVFADYVFEHVALPELNRSEIDTSVEFLGRRLRAPLLISGMTGGTEMAAAINRNLAEAAERAGVALGVGSQRRALEDPGQALTFRVRELAPSIPLLANLGAVQLNYGCGMAECEAAVEMVRADALVFHLNALQEAIQPEGQCNFGGLADKLGAVARRLSVPVVVKEVGCGISGRVGQALAERGVRIIDAAGVGGTSWARIEARRAKDPSTGDLFADWGIPTPQAIAELSRIPSVTVIGSGGVRNGLDAAKALALGADLVGMAYPFLEAAVESADRVEAKIEKTLEELRTCMFCLGVRGVAELNGVSIRRASRKW